MSIDLEQRLRRDLATLDDLPLGSDLRIGDAAPAAFDHAGPGRRLVIVSAAAALVVTAGTGAWWFSNRPDTVATSDTTVAETTAQTTVATTVASIPPTAPVTAPLSASPTAPALPGPPMGTWLAIGANPNGVVVDPMVAWTGSEMLVVGGHDSELQPNSAGARYAPATEAWGQIAPPPAALVDPVRVNAVSLWTGNEMLVIGGDTYVSNELPPGPRQVDGFAYDLANDEWRATAPAPSAIDSRSPWAWTGNELLVWPWGDTDADEPVMPLAYDPSLDEWRQLPEPPVRHRVDAASVWTGTEWLMWGGGDGGEHFSDGVAYQPATESWRVVADSPLSARRINGVWTGSEMIVAGGRSGGDAVTGNGVFAHSDGAAYDPAGDTWRPIANWQAPHPGAQPLWTGRYVVMFAKGHAVIYDPAVDTWYPDCCPSIAAGQILPVTPLWTGSAALLAGSSSPPVGGWSLEIKAGTATTTTVASVVDPLTEALLALGAGVETGPLAATALDGAELCGVEQRGLDVGGQLLLDEQARRCFLDRHLSAQPAVFVEQVTSTEGDPIVIVWRTLADGTIEQHVDATRDDFGSGTWEQVPCDRLTTSFPERSGRRPAFLLRLRVDR